MKIYIKKYSIILVEILLLFINILFFGYNGKHHESIKRDTPKETISSMNMMRNRIDDYFASKFQDHSLTQIELRMYQELYAQLWKEIYDDMMHKIQLKCSYPSDQDNYQQYANEVGHYIENTKPLLLNLLLDNFSMPESPEKNSLGNGTNSRLTYLNGIVYRNACMIFLEYLQDEYSLPDQNDIENWLKNISIE